MRFNFDANNFTSGEWSDKAKARSDTKEYSQACASLQNALVQMQGGAFRRNGTKFISLSSYATLIEGAGRWKMFPVSLSNGVRGAIIAHDKDPNGSGPSTPWLYYNYSTGVLAAVGVVGGSYITDGDVDHAHFEQIGDTIFITSKLVTPRVIAFESAGANAILYPYWKYYFTGSVYAGENAAWKTVPYRELQAANSGGTITITQIAAGGIAAGASVAVTSSLALFSATHTSTTAGSGGLGLLIKLTKGTTAGVVMITAFSSTTSVTGTVVKTVPGAATGETFGSAATTSYELSAWNGVDGYPSTVTSYQQRILFGSSNGFPLTVWGSRIGNVFDMMEIPLSDTADYTGFDTDNSRPFTLPLTAKNGSRIVGLSSAKTLLVHTNTAEVQAYGTQGALGPNDFNFESSTSFGAEYVQPVRVNNFSTFAERGGRKCRDLIFNFDESQYQSNDLSFLSDHLTQGKYVVELIGSKLTGGSFLFARDSGGGLAVCALDRQYKVNAWSPWVFGGAYVGGNPHVLAMASVPATGSNTTNGNDTVIFLIRRTINGSTHIYFEELSVPYESPTYTSQSSAFGHMDARISISQASSVTVSGLSHLEGQVVKVVADGFYIGEKTVASSAITLDRAATEITVGLAQTFVVRPMPIELGSQIGSAVGSFKRVDEVSIKFFNTIGAVYGIYGGDSYNINFRTDYSEDAQTTLIPLFTGVKTFKFPPGYKQEYTIEISTDLPFPCNVLSITMKGVTYD